MTDIVLHPIGVVRNNRVAVEDDAWGDVVSTIMLDDDLPAEALEGIDAFSHVEIVFYFHLVNTEKIVAGARHPRNNPAWPRVGIFAQRGKNRPNRLGVSIARFVAYAGRSLVVAGLDAIDGTPVLDIKPVMREFLPETPVVQPAWVSELMAAYWLAPSPGAAGRGSVG
jgi:tRNA-Thr(GGU) m(6)t(6)A37 methyltransferase TsaA